MFAGTCKVCGGSFLNGTQQKWLRDRIDDPKVLDIVLHVCPECRAKGHGLVGR